MKAREVLKRYAAGERNFQGVNLRGQSFNGKDLKGADFSEAKLQGANFIGANLTGANFTGAKCGRKILLATNLFLIIGFFGIFFNLILFFVIRNFLILFDFNNQIINWLALIFWLVELFFFSFLGIRRLDKTLVREEIVAEAVVMVFASAGAGSFMILIILGIIDDFTVYTVQSDVETLIFYGTILGIFIIALIATSATILKFLEGILPKKITVLVILAITSMIIAPVVERVGLVPLILSGIVLLTTIYLGWNAAKETKRESWLRFFATALASVEGTSFYKADLTDANFTEAKLKSADFTKANLTRVCWLNAKMLDQARIENTYLDNLSLLHLLTTGEGQDKNFDRQDLRRMNLKGANLTDASFIKADLSGANLQEANLSKAKLVQTQLDETDLTGATLTDACLKDWNINSQTNLKDVICDYVYLKENLQECIPYNKHRKFQQGEFAKYVEKALNTVDLIFTDGIDWNAFLTSFKNLQDKYGSDELGIQAIEKKPSGAFVIRVEVSPDINKAEIEKNIKAQYKIKLAKLKQKYKKRLKLKDQDIEHFKQSNTDLIEIVKLQAQKKPTRIIVYPDKYYEQKGENITVSDITQTHSGSGDNVARDKNITNNYNSQDLPQAAAEIQQLLKQLSKTYPTTTSKEKIIVAGEAADQIENNPTLKTKTINALKYAGKEAFKEAINHPVANILMAFIEGWQDTVEHFIKEPEASHWSEEILNWKGCPEF